MTPQIGRYGVWVLRTALDSDLVREIESLGFGAIWIGGSPPGDLALVEDLLDATEQVVIATSIVNMWAVGPAEVASSYHRIESRHPGRFLLGLGIGHPEAVRKYRSPHETITSYLDELDSAGIPQDRRVLAALGPKVLRIAAERCAGAHPYLTTPTHTAGARELLGREPLLAPEQKIVVSTDEEYARRVGRLRVERAYAGLANYRRNLHRMGFTETDTAEVSDRLVDALAVHGDAATVAVGLTAHLDAGADHVCAQILTASGEVDAEYRSALRALASHLPGA